MRTDWMRIYLFKTLDKLEEIYKDLLERDDSDNDSCDNTRERLQAIAKLIVLHKIDLNMLEEYRNKIGEEEKVEEEFNKIQEKYYKKEKETEKYENKLSMQIEKVMKEKFPDLCKQVEL